MRNSIFPCEVQRRLEGKSGYCGHFHPEFLGATSRQKELELQGIPRNLNPCRVIQLSWQGSSDFGARLTRQTEGREPA